LYTIAGTAVNSVTSAPLAGARIAIVQARSRANIFTVTTAEDGKFAFAALVPGKYSLQGSKKGYIAAAYDQHEQYSTAIVTGPGMGTEQLVLRLQPAAQISGHVRDEAAEPVRHATVVLFLEDLRGGVSRIRRAGNSATDDRGYFDFSELIPGTYFVSVSARPWYAIHAVSSPPGRPSQPPTVPPALDVAYATTYYSNASESEGATPIVLGPGDRAQIDMQLSPVPALHVLMRAPEDPQGGARMPVFQKQVFDTPEWANPESMVPIQPGLYELTGVSPGKYTIRMGENESQDSRTILRLNLQHDGEELDASKGEPLATLKVSLKMIGDEQLPKQLSCGLVVPKRRGRMSRLADSNGGLVFQGVEPGKYAMQCADPDGAYAVTRIVSASVDSPGHDISLAAGAQQEVTAWLARGFVRVEGVVQKAGKPMAGVMVVLIPGDPEAHLEYFRRDQSDFDGTFTVSGVIPGTYTLVAVEDAWGTPWLQPGALSRYAEHGQELTIGPLMRGSVHLPEPVEVQAR
jgi:protocatechuate 3,4-dioxygenase beta subunit